MNGNPVLVLSIDGVAPRAISPAATPAICSLASSGAACFTGRTVDPSITLPAHTSMLRGVPPSVHGIMHNEPVAGPMPPSFLSVARTAGLRTASSLSWALMDQMIEPNAVTYRALLDEGYNAADDRFVTDQCVQLLMGPKPDVIFSYLVQPDLAGHEYGWDSDEYHEAVRSADRLLGEMVEAAEPERAILVTTDHGGLGTGHFEANRETTEIFMVVRSSRTTPGGWWPTISPLNVAPTVADLAGFDPDPEWTGSSLVGTETPFLEHLENLLLSMEAVSYGEQLNMLEHSLQTAANAERQELGTAAVAGAVLHDVGHQLASAGQWGVPGHAELAARFLQPWFPALLVESIRLHVEAKRYLVATEDYLPQLSAASRSSLEEQGGPMGPGEQEAFRHGPYWEAAVELRRCDDQGKDAATAGAGSVDRRTVEFYRRFLAEAAGGTRVSPAWARDACICPECRHSHSGQHLLDAEDLGGWEVAAVAEADGEMRVDLYRPDGQTHQCNIASETLHADATVCRGLWGSEHGTVLRSQASDLAGSIHGFAAELSTFGIALVSGRGTESGEVIRFGEEIGFVRRTNYGDLFDVRVDADPINLAFTSKGLPVHTDNPYRDPVPTVQLLHCLVAADGGASLFCDGFEVAGQLRLRHPEDFDLLTRTAVQFRFRSEGVDLQATVPLIRLDAGRNVDRITVNHRSMVAPALGTESEAFYRAYRCFVGLLNDPENLLKITLAPGDLVGFDNRRVLHGRSAFPSSPDRHLQGCYIDIDAVRSMARVGRSVGGTC